MSTDDPRVIGGIIANLRKEARAIVDQVMELCWYMRGSISREEAYLLSPDERKSIIKLTDDNIKRVNETRLPIL